jgi:hypothetical protein
LLLPFSGKQGPILQAYPFCESSTPEKKKKKKFSGKTSFVKLKS